jgi:monoamine oxidase
LAQLIEKRPCNITVLEARDRVGGRTSSIFELNLDLGASWIFAHHTAVRSLANELKISMIDQYESGMSLIDMGNGYVGRRFMHAIHGGASRLKGGTGSLCTQMISELTNRNEPKVNIQFNAPVASIDLKEDGVICVTLRNNGSILADYVVLALPPKLVVSTISLAPTLPTSLIRELSECNTWMATTCKVVLVYKHAWWRDQKLSGFAMSRNSNVQEWHDASSDTCNALFVFCLAGTTQQEAIDATIRMFGQDAMNPTTVYSTDWSQEVFTTVSSSEDRGVHPHMNDLSRQPQWDGRLWLGSSEMSDEDGGFLEGAVRRGIQVAHQLASLISTKHDLV